MELEDSLFFFHAEQKLGRGGGVQCPWQLQVAEKDAFRSAKTSFRNADAPKGIYVSSSKTAE